MRYLRRRFCIGGAATVLAPIAVVISACSFSSNGVGSDATRNDASRLDGPLNDGPIVDARMDARPVDAATRRTRLGLVLRYDFNEAAGATVVEDTSGVAPKRNLRVLFGNGAAAAPTFGNGSLTTNASTVLIDEVANFSAGTKVVDACMLGTITIEAWITQDADAMASGRIITLSKADDSFESNFVVGSPPNMASTAVVAMRTSAAPNAVTLELENGIVATTPQLVVTRYNGSELKLQTLIGPTTNSSDAVNTLALSGSFANWDRAYKLALLNSTEYTNANRSRPWQGSIASLSVYCRSLSDAEVAHDRMLGSESL